MSPSRYITQNATLFLDSATVRFLLTLLFLLSFLSFVSSCTVFNVLSPTLHPLSSSLLALRTPSYPLLPSRSLLPSSSSSLICSFHPLLCLLTSPLPLYIFSSLSSDSSLTFSTCPPSHLHLLSLFLLLLLLLPVASTRTPCAVTVTWPGCLRGCVSGRL